MSTLRSALEELRSEDLRSSSDEELGEDLVELERASRVLEAERSRRLVEVERRGTWSVDGHLSVVSWLAARLRVGFGRASQLVKLARALRHMPVTSRALGEGEVSSEAVGLLISAREAAPEAFSQAEPMLVDAAGALPAREFRAAVSYWRSAADACGAEERTRRIYEGRHLHVSPTIEGTVRIDGDLDPESGQSLITALRSVQDAWSRDGVQDPRTAPQRRADALTELCRSWLDSPERPPVAGERPHVVVTVDLETLAGRPGRRCELSETGPITPEAARRLACDAGVSRVLTPPSPWTWVARPRSCPQGCGGPWCSATAGAASPAAASPRPGVMPTLGSTGRTLGGWRRDRAREPRAALPSPSPSGTRGRPGRDDRKPARVLAIRRDDAGRRSGAAAVGIPRERFSRRGSQRSRRL